MAKRKDARIYLLYHKDVDYGLWDNSLYEPKSVFDSKIGELNPIYCEMSGTFDIWKRHPKSLKYIGQCQYRRRLELEEDFDFEGFFKEADILVADPIYFQTSVREQYANCHNVEDLDKMEKILKEKYPEYSEDWNNRIKGGNVLFYSQGWVMKAEDFDIYCKWLFSLLKEFCKREKIETVEAARKHVEEAAITWKYKCNPIDVTYQTRICGYLAERLFTLYVFHNFKNIACHAYTKFEGINF